jgi:hypothetical protein
MRKRIVWHLDNVIADYGCRLAEWYMGRKRRAA